jgi:hypothetical protein
MQSCKAKDGAPFTPLGALQRRGRGRNRGEGRQRPCVQPLWGEEMEKVQDQAGHARRRRRSPALQNHPTGLPGGEGGFKEKLTVWILARRHRQADAKAFRTLRHGRRRRQGASKASQGDDVENGLIVGASIPGAVDGAGQGRIGEGIGAVRGRTFAAKDGLGDRFKAGVQAAGRLARRGPGALLGEPRLELAQSSRRAEVEARGGIFGPNRRGRARQKSVH